VENLRAGFPVELVARQLGHRDATMVLKVGIARLRTIAGAGLEPATPAL
jgi:hypothetical protein